MALQVHPDRLCTSFGTTSVERNFWNIVWTFRWNFESVSISQHYHPTFPLRGLKIQLGLDYFFWRLYILKMNRRRLWKLIIAIVGFCSFGGWSREYPPENLVLRPFFSVLIFITFLSGPGKPHAHILWVFARPRMSSSFIKISYFDCNLFLHFFFCDAAAVTVYRDPEIFTYGCIFVCKHLFEVMRRSVKILFAKSSLGLRSVTSEEEGLSFVPRFSSKRGEK